MDSVLEFIREISLFDSAFVFIMIYSVIQCFLKGFSLSFISFLKWVLSLVITIILVPQLNSWVQNFIESKFIADIGLGIFIYIISLFVIINIGKAISKAVTWTGLGSVDKTFGLIFGIFKGYVVCVCVFSLLNWFYPHQKWPIKAERAYSFELIYKGSKILIKEFPKSKDYYEQTEEKIEKI